MTTVRRLEIRIDQSGNAESRMGGLLKATGGLAKVAGGVALGGVLALGGGLAGAGVAGLGLNNAMELATAKINAFTKDGEKTAGILDMIRDRAAKTPFEFQEMASAASALLPSAKQAQTGLEDLIAQAEILAASNPSEGLEGAAFALKEAVSGDFTSIIERFNLPRQYINQLKDEGVPALEIVSRAMGEMGLDADLVGSLAETASGRWSTFKDTLQGLASTITQPIFDAFSSGLGGVNGLLEANAPRLQAMADTLAGGIRSGLDWVNNVGVPAIQAMADRAGLLADVFEQRGFDGLFAVFEDGSSYIGGFLETLGLSEEASDRLGAGIARTGQTVIEFARGWQARWGEIRTQAQEVLDGLQPYWARLQGILLGFSRQIVPELRQVWQTVIDVWRGDLKPALDELWAAFDELFVELGFGKGEVDFLSLALDVVKAGLHGVVLVVRILSPIIRLWANNVSFAIGYVKMLVDAVGSMKRGFDAVMGPIGRVADKIRGLINQARNLPSWLIPGSPTPFELGLRGIARAAGEVGGSLPAAFGGMSGGLAPAGIPGGGGGAVVVNLTYAPTVSTADQMELERVLTEVVDRINRRRA